MILKQGNATSITTPLDNDGNMPFRLVVWNDDVEIVSALLDKGTIGSAPIADDRTPLHLASSRGNYDVAKLLLERKCAVLQDEDEETPSHATCWSSEATRIV